MEKLGAIKPEFNATSDVASFGSYGLGLHLATSDLDLLFIATNFIDRSDLENSFSQYVAKHPIVTVIATA